jgi:hypothetical protein
MTRASLQLGQLGLRLRRHNPLRQELRRR